ncbi:MAG: DUF2071 domain-containing protein [Planctomycetota bacterium]
MPLRHTSLRMTDHRPYPVPARPWAVAMTWRDLGFLHWPVDVDAMRRALPGGFEPDLFDGQAWLGIVPFVMDNVRPRFLPAVPRGCGRVSLSRFPELNVRTYVTCGGEPGVLFFSLDAASPGFVRLGRWRGIGPLHGFGLPYFRAKMNVEVEADSDGWTHYTSERTHADAPAAEFAARYRALPGSVPTPATPGTFDHFLTERYRLYSVDRNGRPLVGEVHHAAWPLQQAECEIEVCEMTGGTGLALPEVAPIAHYAKRIDVVGWRPIPVRGS